MFRDQGKIGSVYDSNVTSFDPFPYSPVTVDQMPIMGDLGPLRKTQDAYDAIEDQLSALMKTLRTAQAVGDK